MEWTRAAMSSKAGKSNPAPKSGGESSKGGGVPSKAAGATKAVPRDSAQAKEDKSKQAQEQEAPILFGIDEDRKKYKFFSTEIVEATVRTLPALTEQEAASLLKQMGPEQFVGVTTEQVPVLVETWARGVLKTSSEVWPTALRARVEVAKVDFFGMEVEDMEMGVRFLLDPQQWKERLSVVCEFRSEIRNVAANVSKPDQMSAKMCEVVAETLREAFPKKQRVFDLTYGPNNVLSAVHALAYFGMREAKIAIPGAPNALLANLPPDEVMHIFNLLLTDTEFDDRVSKASEYFLECQKQKEDASESSEGEGEEEGGGDQDMSEEGGAEERSENADEDDSQAESAKDSDAAVTAEARSGDEDDEDDEDDEEEQDEQEDEEDEAEEVQILKPVEGAKKLTPVEVAKKLIPAPPHAAPPSLDEEATKQVAGGRTKKDSLSKTGSASKETAEPQTAAGEVTKPDKKKQRLAARELAKEEVDEAANQEAAKVAAANEEAANAVKNEGSVQKKRAGRSESKKKK